MGSIVAMGDNTETEQGKKLKAWLKRILYADFALYDHIVQVQDRLPEISTRI